ncbi:hypothetical protein MSAN_00703700 [Mycena sanguinolenta]|uniref:Uncharacterized protein n=1 Tax=Mycena sanguinolenta TaxID=230812 RepID=A0A8H7DDT2_9AGAR|nr:hypothetical protein MSAN_00703700 [Mycena sanguinolenta]
MSKITETATSIVSLLGGPQFNPEDIDWALDLPAGQRLLDWLVSQVEIPGSPAKNTDASPSLAAALHAVALEDDEIRSRHATKKPATTVDRFAPSEIHSTVPSGYIAPWRLRAKEEFTLEEAARLEAETESLKARLKQAKIASQSLTQALKFLASEIETTESDIQAAESGLSELSLKADAAILGSVNASIGLVDKCTPNDSAEAQDESLLTAVSSVCATATDHFRQQMQTIDVAERHLPSPAELLSECGRLDAALRKTGADPLLNRELARLCTELEDSDTGKDALATMLAEKPRHQGQRPSTDVAAELEAAWARDQAALLDARAAVLDEAIAAFSESLLPPLTALHNNITAQNAHMNEAQAYIGALGAEIQDITENVRAAQESQPKPSTLGAEENQDMELQAGLTSLLKQLKDLRPPDASPLILLSQEDILNELRDIYTRAEASRRREEEWVANLLPTLRNLETGHAPLLNASYAHSPLNSSTPFSVPPDVQAVYADAKSKADALGEAINKLQEDVKGVTNDRAKRKMEQFISKWTN